MSKITKSSLHPVYLQIREILSRARSQAWQAVNVAMVTAYWNIGRVIVEEEQKGESRAKYGEYLIEGLSHKLSAEFGKGFDRSNLWNMRAFYEAEAVNARWSTRELERQINSLLFERLALSRDKKILVVDENILFSDFRFTPCLISEFQSTQGNK